MRVIVQMSIIKDIIYESANYGANKQALATAAGFDLAELDDGDRWIELPTAHRVWELALSHTQQPHLGLLIGRSSNPHVIGLLGYLMESCPTIGDALEQLSKFNPLFGNMFSYHYEIQGAYFKVFYEPHPQWWQAYPHTAQQAIETSMSRTLSIIHRFSGKHIYPSRAFFKYPSPANEEPYKSILKTNLYFGATENYLEFPASLAKLAVASYNVTLYREFEHLAQAKLVSFQTYASLEARIKQLLLSAIDGPLPTIDQVATQLQCSTRTLQRKLRQEGTSYQLILENIRKELALHFLQKRQNKLTEIAGFLGYADQRVFRRAFKRWTGQTPSTYQQQLP